MVRLHSRHRLEKDGFRWEFCVTPSGWVVQVFPRRRHGKDSLLQVATTLQHRRISLPGPVSLRVGRGRSLKDTEIPRTRLLPPTLTVVVTVHGTTTKTFVVTSTSVEGLRRSSRSFQGHGEGSYIIRSRCDLKWFYPRNLRDPFHPGRGKPDVVISSSLLSRYFSLSKLVADQE